MVDLCHYWGGDIGAPNAAGVPSAGANGDFAKVDGINLGIQRVIRRLMTCQGEYIFQPNYGASIPQRIGRPYDTRVIQAIVRSQIFLESVVAKTPPPIITVTSIQGGVSVYIKYYDTNAQKSVNFTFPIQARPVTQSQQTDLSFQVPT